MAFASTSTAPQVPSNGQYASSPTSMPSMSTQQQQQQQQQQQHHQQQHQQPQHQQAPHRPRPISRHHWTASLSRDLHNFVIQLLPTSEEMAVKEDVRKLLERLIRTLEPDSRLLSFGSTANGFSLRNSDMDLCCLIDSEQPPLNASDLVTMVGDLLTRETKFKVKTLPHARIPIVKLSLDPSPGLPYGISCDIGFENRLALENTRLLMSYASIDPLRVRTLVIFLKVWSKRRKINSPYSGTLSSYGYVLLVIFFLVHVKNPPVLPNLQQMPPLRPISHEDTHIGEHNIWFFDDIELLKERWQSSSTESVGELLIDFFKYFSRDFTYNVGVASIRAGLLKKSSKGWLSDYKENSRYHDSSRDRNRFCIEDPFETDYNVARCVTKEGLYTIRGEFMRASRILSARPERTIVALAQLCEEREDEFVRPLAPQPFVPPRLASSVAAPGPDPVPVPPQPPQTGESSSSGDEPQPSGPGGSGGAPSDPAAAATTTTTTTTDGPVSPISPTMATAAAAAAVKADPNTNTNTGTTTTTTTADQATEAVALPPPPPPPSTLPTLPHESEPPEHMAPRRLKWTSPPPPDDPDHTEYESRLGLGLTLATSSTTARQPVRLLAEKSETSSSGCGSEVLSELSEDEDFEREERDADEEVEVESVGSSSFASVDGIASGTGAVAGAIGTGNGSAVAAANHHHRHNQQHSHARGAAQPAQPAHSYALSTTPISPMSPTSPTSLPNNSNINNNHKSQLQQHHPQRPPLSFFAAEEEPGWLVINTPKAANEPLARGRLPVRYGFGSSFSSGIVPEPSSATPTPTMKSHPRSGGGNAGAANSTTNEGVVVVVFEHPSESAASRRSMSGPPGSSTPTPVPIPVRRTSEGSSGENAARLDAESTAAASVTGSARSGGRPAPLRTVTTGLTMPTTYATAVSSVRTPFPLYQQVPSPTAAVAAVTATVAHSYPPRAHSLTHVHTHTVRAAHVHPQAMYAAVVASSPVATTAGGGSGAGAGAAAGGGVASAGSGLTTVPSHAFTAHHPAGVGVMPPSVLEMDHHHPHHHHHHQHQHQHQQQQQHLRRSWHQYASLSVGMGVGVAGGSSSSSATSPVASSSASAASSVSHSPVLMSAPGSPLSATRMGTGVGRRGGGSTKQAQYGHEQHALVGMNSPTPTPASMSRSSSSGIVSVSGSGSGSGSGASPLSSSSLSGHEGRERERETAFVRDDAVKKDKKDKKTKKARQQLKGENNNKAAVEVAREEKSRTASGGGERQSGEPRSPQQQQQHSENRKKEKENSAPSLASSLPSLDKRSSSSPTSSFRQDE